MFRCEQCNTSPPNTYEKTSRPNKVVVERENDYAHRDKEGNLTGMRGSQIVREMNVCDTCLPNVTEAFKQPKVLLENRPRRKDFTGASDSI